MTKPIKKWLGHVSKIDFTFIVILFSATFITRMLLIFNAPFIYAQDAYGYLGEARDFAFRGSIRFERGMPFVVSLGISLKILGPILGDFTTARLFMLITSVLPIIVMYLLGLRISGRLLGFFATMLAVFEPYSLKYSIVPYTDVFAMAIGLTAFYLTTSYKKLLIILAPFFFYVAVFTRPELYFALVISILVFYFCRSLKIGSKGYGSGGLKKLGIFVFMVYFLPFIIIYPYVQSWAVGAFGIRERFALFFKSELLVTTLNSSFCFYDQQFVNQAITLIVGGILALALFTSIVSIDFNKVGRKFYIYLHKQTEKVKDALLSDGGIIAFSLFLFFVVHVITLTVWSYGYKWAFYVSDSDLTNLDILREAVIITPPLHDRYLIPLRLLICYPLAYPLTIVVRKIGESICEK